MYDHLIGEWLATPWALRREVLHAHARVVATHMANKMRGEGLGRMRAFDDDDDGTPRISAFEARRRDAQARAGSGNIAVLPLYGTIVQRAGMMTEWCGGTSTQQFGDALKAAMADESIGQILIDMDSPGGSVYGVAELGAQVYEARKTKPVVAIANSVSASACYWVGSQASEVYVTPGGDVGSIGVWMAHEDWSAALKEAGVDITLISAGAYKTEGNPYQPLGDEAKAFFQSRCDDYYRDFTAAVARGRNVPVASVREGMGQGRVLGAAAAVEQKMVDGIATFDEVIRKMQRDARSNGGGRSALAAARNELALVGG